MYLIIAAALAGLASVLKLAKPTDCTVEHPTPAGALALIVVCGIAYTLFYLVFGAITYQFFTKAYYPGADQIARDLGLWFWVIQIGRGVFMTVAVLPAIYTLRMTRWQTAIAEGTIVWVAGGLAPLLVPNELMGRRRSA
jgi:multisubunit Na+/H+ antiporter MnhB subunit